MKGFFTGIVVAAPLTALILMLVLGGQQEIRTDQERLRTQQRIDELQFDQDFERAWNSLDPSGSAGGAPGMAKTDKAGGPSKAANSGQEGADEKQLTRREKRLRELRRRRQRFEQQWNKQFRGFDRRLGEMRGALKEKGQESKHLNWPDPSGGGQQ